MSELRGGQMELLVTMDFSSPSFVPVSTCIDVLMNYLITSMC